MARNTTPIWLQRAWRQAAERAKQREEAGDVTPVRASGSPQATPDACDEEPTPRELSGQPADPDGNGRASSEPPPDYYDGFGDDLSRKQF
jgi:hypothetical protein